MDKNQSERRLELSKTGLKGKLGLVHPVTVNVKIFPKNREHDESHLHGTPEMPDAFGNPSQTDLPGASENLDNVQVAVGEELEKPEVPNLARSPDEVKMPDALDDIIRTTSEDLDSEQMPDACETHIQIFLKGSPGSAAPATPCGTSGKPGTSVPQSFFCPRLSPEDTRSLCDQRREMPCTTHKQHRIYICMNIYASTSPTTHAETRAKTHHLDLFLPLPSHSMHRSFPCKTCLICILPLPPSPLCTNECLARAQRIASAQQLGRERKPHALQTTLQREACRKRPHWWTRNSRGGMLCDMCQSRT